jgi:hypothetical protein
MQALATRWFFVCALGRRAAASRGAARLSAGRGAQDSSSRAAGAGEPRETAPPHSQRGEAIHVPLRAVDVRAGASSLWSIPPSRLPAEAVDAETQQEQWTFHALDIEDESDLIEQKKWTQQEQELEAAEQGRVNEG